MVGNEVVVKPESSRSEKALKDPLQRLHHRKSRRRRWLVLLAILLACGGGALVFAWSLEHSRSAERSHSSRNPAAGSRSFLPRVQVIHPQRGGMERTTDQPGTIRAFEFAELYA